MTAVLKEKPRVVGVVATANDQLPVAGVAPALKAPDQNIQPLAHVAAPDLMRRFNPSLIVRFFVDRVLMPQRASC
jgi:hypothetical protein